MITRNQKEIAQWAMDLALKNSCQAARISIIAGINNSFEYRNTQLDKLQQSSENRFYIELFVDGKYGTFSTNRIVKSELESFINEGIESTKFLAEDVCRQLPDSKRYYSNDGFDLDQYDETFDAIKTSDKLELAKNAVEEIYGTDDRIISVLASYDDGVGAEYMIASNGLETESLDSAYNLTVEIALKTGGDSRAESFWYDSSIFWDKLNCSNLGGKALERALGKIDQKKINSGNYNLLLDNNVSPRIISPLIRAMYGSALQQKNSFLLDKLGEKIVSSLLTIEDNPHIPRMFGSRWCDGEGVATQNRSIIKDGILDTYFIDTYNSLKMNVSPTISSPSIVNVRSGNYDFIGLLKTMGNGIWVTGFNGGNCNSTTGDFSFGVEGFLIENGLATIPIGEMNITGNMLQLWSNLVEVGNDPLLNASWLIPSLLFEGVNFSGL